MTRPRVLLIAPVPGLSRALYRRKVPFVVWSEEETRVRGAEEVLVHPYTQSRRTAEELLQPQLEDGWFTHVLAGRPAGEVSASHARSIAGARAAESPVMLRFGGSEGWADALEDRGVPVAEPETPVEASLLSLVQDGQDRFQCAVEWHEHGQILGIPAPLDEAQQQSLAELYQAVLQHSELSWGVLHLRVCFPEGRATLIQATLSPPAGALIDLLGLAYDFDAWNAVVDVEMDHAFEVPSALRAPSALWAPRSKDALRLEGLDEAKKLPGVEAVKFQLDDGVVVPADPAEGVLGHVLLQASNRDALRDALDAARRTLRFTPASPDHS